MGEKIYGACEERKCVAEEVETERGRICEVIDKTTHILDEADECLNAMFTLIGVELPPLAPQEKPNNMREAVELNRDLAIMVMRKIHAISEVL